MWYLMLFNEPIDQSLTGMGKKMFPYLIAWTTSGNFCWKIFVRSLPRPLTRFSISNQRFSISNSSNLDNAYTSAKDGWIVLWAKMTQSKAMASRGWKRKRPDVQHHSTDEGAHIWITPGFFDNINQHFKLIYIISKHDYRYCYSNPIRALKSGYKVQKKSTQEDYPGLKCW